MTYKDCSACKSAGTTPQEITVPKVVYWPPIQWPGQPTLDGHGLSAEFLANYAWHQGVDGTVEDYDLSRAKVLVCMWWVGRYGSRTWKKRLGEWAKVADVHLWYSCGSVPEPPRRSDR